MPKNPRTSAALLLSFFLGGCVASQPLPKPALDHPANPDAPESAPIPASDTLAIQPTIKPTSHPTTAPLEGAHHHGH